MAIIIINIIIIYSSTRKLAFQFLSSKWQPEQGPWVPSTENKLGAQGREWLVAIQVCSPFHLSLGPSFAASTGR